MLGGGDWVSYCGVCGIHLDISFDSKDIESYFKSIITEKNRKKIEKIIINFKLLKSLKNTFIRYNKITLLFPNNIIKHNVKYLGNYDFKYRDKYYENVSYIKSKSKYTEGIPLHTECWKLANTKFKHSLTFDDFMLNKTIKYNKKDYYLFKNLNYNPADKYKSQLWQFNLYNIDDSAFLLNKKNWYIIYLPSYNNKLSIKNAKRIEKNIKKIINGIKKSNNIQKKIKVRCSPSESATLYKVGIRKKGNDGNFYIIKKTKNGIKRWIRDK